ncbi:pseudouridine synthase [Treponema sp.]|uniref:pseudouridine synthase n=1 Tax=Treponema sp. TaxID=166 RepID=UPI00388D7968
MKIIHTPDENSPFLIVEKPAGIATAPLKEGDESILTQAILKFPQIKNVHGRKEVEYGLVHRIDTETEGLVLIATTQKAFDFFIKIQKEGLFEKWYQAKFTKVQNISDFLEGFPPVSENTKTISSGSSFSIESCFRSFGKNGCEVRPVTQNAGRAALKKAGQKIYRTEVFIENEDTAVCHIKEGYRHQVRCHLSWAGLPIKGDCIYNPEARSKNTKIKMEFRAFKISFPHPLTQTPLTFQM